MEHAGKLELKGLKNLVILRSGSITDSPAAPETCAKFLGSFIADKTNSSLGKMLKSF